MASYGNGRDPYPRDGPSRSYDACARSRSPPPRHYQERDRVVARINRHDHDGPAVPLPRKPGTSANALPVSTAAGSSNHGHASASSSSALDRNATGNRSNSSTYTDASSARRGSAVVEVPADLFERISASLAERQLFDQIESKRASIAESRRDLDDQLKRLPSLEKLVTQRGTAELLKQLQEKKVGIISIEHKIQTDTDLMYRMQVQWQIELSKQIVPSLLGAALVPLEAKLHEVTAELKSEQDRDRKHQEDFEKYAKTHFGHSNRFQSDISKINSDLSALTRDNLAIRESMKAMRKDLDKDVRQLNINREDIKKIKHRLETAEGSAHAASTAPSSPRSISQPRPSTSTNTTSSLAANANGGTTNDVPAGSSPARESKAVTQAQFRKWSRDHALDLEMRLDETKDLAVQEAMAENQVYMHNHLRALVREWRKKALAGGDLSSPGAQAAPIANGNESASSGASAAVDGAMPMEVDDSNGHQVQPNNVLAAKGSKASSNAETETNKHGSTAPTQTQPTSDTQAAASVPNAASQATASASDKVTSSQVDPRSAGQLATPPLQPAHQSTQTESAEKSDREHVSVPAAALTTIDLSLKQHETQLAEYKTQLAALENAVTLVRSEIDSNLDRWLASPDKIKQLLRALKLNGLDNLNNDVREAVAQLQNVVTQNRLAIEELRTSQQELKQESIAYIDEKVKWPQQQIEALDDQSSLQGALLVKLCEHANPRRNRPPAAASTSGSARVSAGPQSPAIPPSVAQHRPSSAGALRPDHQMQHAVQQHPNVLPNPMMRPQSSLVGAAAATALSAHMQPPLYPQQQQQQPAVLHPAQAQAYQQAATYQQQQQQQQQHQQHSPYVVPRAPVVYQDPNQRPRYQ